MEILDAIRHSRAPAFALTAVGILWGCFAALVPDIKAYAQASDAELGSALLMSAIGGIAAMWVAPRIVQMLGWLALPLAGIAVSFATIYPIFARDALTLGLAMLAMGASVALLDITANVEISSREARTGLHLMNLNHAMFSFAFAAAAYSGGLARKADWNLTQTLPVTALVCLALVPLMRQSSAKYPVATRVGAPRRVPWLVIALTGLILCASFIGENATEAWSALHIERTLGAPSGEGSLGPAVLGLVMGIGRLAGQSLSRWLGHEVLIVWSTVLAVAGVLVVAAASSPAVAVLGVALGALGLATIVPSANTMLGARVTEEQRAHALSRAWMLGILGFFFGPAMIGGVAEISSLRVSFVMVAVVLTMILPAIWLLARLQVLNRPVRSNQCQTK